MNAVDEICATHRLPDAHRKNLNNCADFASMLDEVDWFSEHVIELMKRPKFGDPPLSYDMEYVVNHLMDCVYFHCKTGELTQKLQRLNAVGALIPSHVRDAVVTSIIDWGREHVNPRDAVLTSK